MRNRNLDSNALLTLLLSITVQKALDLAAEELEKKCQLVSKQLAATKLSVVPGILTSWFCLF